MFGRIKSEKLLLLEKDNGKDIKDWLRMFIKKWLDWNYQPEIFMSLYQKEMFWRKNKNKIKPELWKHQFRIIVSKLGMNQIRITFKINGMNNPKKKVFFQNKFYY